ncbi:MAG: PKD domain-containing protein [Thermodesulfobacteriota bacterium]
MSGCSAPVLSWAGRLFLGLLVLLGTCPVLPAAEITLTWDANREPRLAGYRIYWGQASRSYSQSADAGPATTFTVTGLAPDQTFYFAATAYDGAGNESPFSDEISWRSPAAPAAAPEVPAQTPPPGRDEAAPAPASVPEDPVQAPPPSRDQAAPAPAVVPNRPPVAAASFRLDTASLLVRFDGSASQDPDGQIVQHRWQFGDGAQGNGALAEHAYGIAGQYQVRLAVTDNSGASGDATLAVTVSPPADRRPPQAAISTSASLTTVGAVVQVDGTASRDPQGRIVATAWDFGDGSTASGATASHAYQLPGRYTIALTVRNDVGLSSRAQALVTVTEAAPELTRLSVSFQPDGSPPPDGFLMDNGQPFDQDRGFGWLPERGPRTLIDLNRSTAPDQAYDSVAILPASAVWEAEVPNGSYLVTACLTDPVASGRPGGRQSVQAEGAAIIADGPLGQEVRWLEESGEVAVTDGRLTLSFTGSLPVAILAWVRIEQILPPEERLQPQMSASLQAGRTAVRFDASASSSPGGPILDYAWELGDGATGSGVVVEHELPAAGLYTVTLRLLDSRGRRGETRQTYWLADGQQDQELAVSFQPAGAAVPAGFLVDSGLSFANNRGYGWLPAGTRLKSVDLNKRQSPDQAHDTAVFAPPAARWEVALANGWYRVRIGLLDPMSGRQGQTGQSVQVEDEALVTQEPFGQGLRWIEGETEVEVADGRLTLGFAGSNPLAILCWLHVQRLP